MVPNVVDHEVERQWVPVNEDLVIQLLHGVPAGEHRFQGAALHVAKGRAAHGEVVLAAYV